MPRLIQPRSSEPTSDLVEEVFKRHGFSAEAQALASLCRATGLGGQAAGELDEDHERVVAHVAEALRRSAPRDVPVDVLLLLEVHELQRVVHQGFRNGPSDPVAILTAAIDEFVRGRSDVSDAVLRIFQLVKGVDADLKDIVRALVGRGLVDPARFISVDAIRTTKKGTGLENWNQHARENDPSLPDYWVVVDAERALDAFRRLFEREPIATLGAFALGLERSISLRYPGESAHLYPHLDPLAQVLCRRRRTEAAGQDRQLTRCCWSYGRLAAERAAQVLGLDYKALKDLALAELGEMRTALRGAHADVLFAEQGDYLTDAVFFVLRTDATSLWGVLRRLILALRDLRHRGVPLDLRTWNEPGFESVPLPWNWLPDHIARVLELLPGRELERDHQLKELRRELAKFCLDRIKTRDKSRDENVAVTNDSFVEPDPIWRAAYINAVKELHPNLGERGHHALTWSQGHDPDEDVRVAARSAAPIVRHGHGLPSNTSPRRAMFAAFWWLRQAHVVSLGDEVEVEGAQRTFRKEMRRQADLEP